MKSALVVGLCLLGVSAQAHTIVDGHGVGLPAFGCDTCGVVKFSGGAHHSDAVRMTINVGSGAEREIRDMNFMYVAFRLDSFAPAAPDTICAFQLERGPSYVVGDPPREHLDDWPDYTKVEGYYHADLKAYVVQFTSPVDTAFRVGSVLAASAVCPKRDK